jgi:hypothetical protein
MVLMLYDESMNFLTRKREWVFELLLAIHNPLERVMRRAQKVTV